MKKNLSVFLWAFLASGGVAFSQQAYKGKLVSKLGGEQTGTITVNLDGANNELIEIETTEKPTSRKAGRKQKQSVTTSMKLNTAIISYIVINDTTYYFRDIKYDYNDKYQENVCVRLVAGTLNCGIFQTGRSTGDNNISVKLPKEEFSKLVSTEFDYYKETSGWHLMAFSNCKPLYNKIDTKEKGFIWQGAASPAERIAVWKNWIAAYNTACGK